MEYIIGIEGTLTLELKDESYTVEPEDALLFQSDKEHSYKNETDARVRLVSVFAFLPKA